MTNVLDRARWQRLSVILDQAIELPQERRARFVEEVCGGDRDLLADVDDLLAAAGAPDDFLAKPAADVLLQRRFPLSGIGNVRVSEGHMESEDAVDCTNSRVWRRMALVVIATAPLYSFQVFAAASGANKACELLTPADIEAALGAKVSTFAEGAAGFCSASAPTVTVTVRIAKKGGAPGREAKGIEMMKQMGGQVDVKSFGSVTCSTLVPPENLVKTVGFNTTCSVTKGDTVAAVEVTAKAHADMVAIDRLRPLAEKLATRF